MDYLDFTLEVTRIAGQDFHVSVRSPGGEARVTARFPFDYLDLKSILRDLEQALRRSGGPLRRVLSAEEKTVQSFGHGLFDFLIADDVRTRYDVSQSIAAQKGKGLRVVLRIQDAELAALPWEFLYDPRTAGYVCLSRHTPIVRYPDLPHPVPPLTVKPPLQILGMAVSPHGLDRINVAREIQRVDEATAHLRGLVEVTWFGGQTWRDLQAAMRRGHWHIFHFIGHGGFDHARDEGFIALADENGRTFKELRATELALLLDHSDLKLVVLNSCEGARGSSLDVFSSAASILVRRGIPSVLAMQYAITDLAAIEFSRSFYGALAGGMSVEAAVSEGRKAVNVGVGNTLEWGTPVLYLRASDGRLFDVDVPREQIEALYDDAKRSAGEEDWEAAVEKLTVVVHWDPAHTEARSALNHAVAQRKISELYAEGEALYQAGRLQEALGCLLRVKAERGDYRDTPGLVSNIEARLRAERIKALSDEAEAAASRGDLAAAIARLESALKLDAADAEVGARLSRLREEQELASLHAAGLSHYDARRWAEALELFRQVEGRAGDYKGARSLIANAQAGLREEAAAKRLRARIDGLRGKAARAAASGDWGAAAKSLRAILSLDPADAAASAELKEVGRRQKLEALYEQARKHYRRGRWREALGALQRVSEIGGDYKDTRALISAAAIELEREEKAAAAAETPAAGTDDAVPPPGPASPRPASPPPGGVAATPALERGRARRRSTVVIVILIPLAAVVGLALWASRRGEESPRPRNDNAPSATPTPGRSEDAREPQPRSLSVDLLGELSAGRDLYEVAFGPGGRILAAVGEEKGVILWRPEDGGALPALKGATSPSRSIAISPHTPESMLVASGDDRGVVRLWRLVDGGEGRAFKTLRGHTGYVFNVAFSADGQTLTSVSADRSVRRWSVDDGKELERIQLPAQENVAALDPSQRAVALYLDSRSMGRSISLWSLDERRKLTPPIEQESPVTCGAFSPDGGALAIGSEDGAVRLRRVSDGGLSTPVDLEVKGGTPHILTFSPDGRVLAAGWSDGFIRLWRVSDGRLLKEWKGHQEPADNLTFSGDGKMLASGGGRRLVLWRVTRN